MKGPGALATALLLRRLTRTIEQTNKFLERIAEASELRLKLDAVRLNIPLSALRDLEEDLPGGEPGVLTQTEEELTLLEELAQQYEKQHGHPPADSDDLLELLKER